MSKHRITRHEWDQMPVRTKAAQRLLEAQIVKHLANGIKKPCYRRKDTESKFVLKVDLRKYFKSINKKK